MIGMTCVYPIDVIKTRIQNSATQVNAWRTLTNLLKNERFMALYKGLGPQLCGTIPDKAISLATREFVKSRFEDPTTFKASFASAALSGVTQSVVMCPVELVKVRLQLDSSLNVTKVIRELGLRGAYNGYSATFMRDTCFAAIYFTLYDAAKKQFNIVEGSSIGMSLLAASAAGIPAAYVTTPLDMLKTRLQARGNTLTLRETFRDVYGKRGLSGMFAGWGPRVLRIAPQFGIVLMSYDWIAAKVTG